MGNCRQACNPTPEQKPPSVNAKAIPTRPSQITIQQFVLKCQICGIQVNNSNMKSHLDLYHFVQVIEKSSTQFQVVCLLCNLKSNNLESHQNHLKTKHFYIESAYQEIIIDEQQKRIIQSNQSLKSKVSCVPKIDINVHSNGRKGQISGETYDVQIYQKQYSPIEFNENLATAELVWIHIFTKFRKNACFYNIQFVPKQRSIFVISKIFYKENYC